MFSESDQLAFGKLSGDTNPIHLDEIYSRRSLYGERVVHGINLMLWALDNVVKKIELPINEFEASFHKPAFLMEKVNIKLSLSNSTIILNNGHATICTIRFKTNSQELLTKKIVTQCNKQKKRPKRVSFKNTKFLTKTNIVISNELDLCKELYPNLANIWGETKVLEIASTSMVVGMECPGLNSIFAKISCVLKNHIHNQANYSLNSIDARFNCVNLNFNGCEIDATLTALFRPAPPRSKSFGKIESLVSNNEFNNIRALIIGGSRGLGAATGKIIAAGGGHVEFTYSQGKNEAERLVRAILQKRKSAMSCSKLLIDSSFNLKSLSHINLAEFNRIYYFPSAKIIPDYFKPNNLGNSKKYNEIYVQGLEIICAWLSQKKWGGMLIYPSTDFLTNPDTKYLTYINAKLEGEKICEKYRSLRGLNVAIVRLPKLKTDQTMSIIKETKILSPEPILVEHIRKLEALESSISP